MEAITKFLSVSKGGGSSDGYGYGYDYGRGYGRGDGSGNGSGDGYGYGYGYGRGDGYGGGSSDASGYGYDDGYGNALKSYNGQKVYIVDDLDTIIYSAKNNIAKGAVVNDDLSLTECYIAKVDDCFAHGRTAHDAFADAQKKALQKEPIEERINRFATTYPNFDKKIPAQELFEWHNILTGSCEFGRRQFAASHGINLETDSFTVKEFIKLTKDEYGGENIKKLIT